MKSSAYSGLYSAFGLGSVLLDFIFSLISLLQALHDRVYLGGLVILEHVLLFVFQFSLLQYPSLALL